MVRNVHPVQRFSPDVVDARRQPQSVAYLFGVARKIRAAEVRTGAAVGAARE
jgi:hypothetical protein